nr:hypothetical protein [Tanacetum cinerariifolium]
MVLNNKGKIIGPKESRLVWDNTTRVNHQRKLTHPHPKRKFIPAAVLTKSGQVPVNAAKQSSHRAAASVSAARHVNTAASRPNVNDALPTTYSYFKAHSPVRRPFNQKSAAKTKIFNEKGNTARVDNVTTDGLKAVVSAAEGNRDNVVKSSACWIWKPKGNLIDHVSKDSGSYTLKRFDYKLMVDLLHLEEMLEDVKGEGSGQTSEPQPPSLTASPFREEQVTIVASQPQKTHTPRQATRGQDTKIPQFSGPPKKGTGSEHQDDLTDFVPPTPHDSPLSGGHIPGSDDGRPNTAQDLVIKKLQKEVKSLEKKQRARTSGMNLFKIGTSKRKSLDKENVSKQGRNLKTRLMFEECDIDDDFDGINDMVDEVMENVEGDTVNAGGAVNTATTGVSTASASVTSAGISISTAETRIPPTTTTTAFEDEDLTIAQTLVKMRSEKAKEKGVAFRDVESTRPTIILLTIDPKDKGKGIMQEPEKPLKNPRKAHIQLDEELAKRMHEEVLGIHFT